MLHFAYVYCLMSNECLISYLIDLYFNLTVPWPYPVKLVLIYSLFKRIQLCPNPPNRLGESITQTKLWKIHSVNWGTYIEWITGPLKLCKWNHHALVKFHIRWYLWVCGHQKIWKLKISDGVFLIFLILWKKFEENLEKNFQKNFFFTKICFSELEKAYVQLFVLNFFLSRN